MLPSVWNLFLASTGATVSVSGVIFLGVLGFVLLGALGVVITVFARKTMRVRWRLAAPLFCAGWVSLLLAGILFSGAILALMAFPLAAAALALFALLWRACSPWNWRANLCYWVGIPLMVWGVFRFGRNVGILHALATHYAAPEYLPPRPNMLEELLFGAFRRFWSSRA